MAIQPSLKDSKGDSMTPDPSTQSHAKSELENQPQKTASSPSTGGMPLRRTLQTGDAHAAHDEGQKSQTAKSAGAAASGSDIIQDFGQYASEMDQSVRKFIQERPVTAMLTAVGVGLAGSWLFNTLSQRNANERRPSNR